MNRTNNPALSRVGSACGAVFAIVLFVANGDGSQPFSGPRAVAGLAALALAIPFLGYLATLLRPATEAGGWLATTALGSGIAWVALKLGSGAPELAMVKAHVAAGSELHAGLEGIAGRRDGHQPVPARRLLRGHRGARVPHPGAAALAGGRRRDHRRGPRGQRGRASDHQRARHAAVRAVDPARQRVPDDPAWRTPAAAHSVPEQAMAATETAMRG